MKRRKGSTSAATKGETWAILTADGKLVREMEWGKGAALTFAQNVARDAPVGSTFYVKHRHLLGPSSTLYRVDHVEEGIGGVVLTTTLADTD